MSAGQAGLPSVSAVRGRSLPGPLPQSHGTRAIRLLEARLEVRPVELVDLLVERAYDLGQGHGSASGKLHSGSDRRAGDHSIGRMTPRYFLQAALLAVFLWLSACGGAPSSDGTQTLAEGPPQWRSVEALEGWFAITVRARSPCFLRFRVEGANDTPHT